jgi:hypothetical protein
VFHRRVQLSDGSCLQFVSALRSFLAKCEYREVVRDELLQDRFMTDCATHKIRERLTLKSDDMTCAVTFTRWNNNKALTVYRS